MAIGADGIGAMEFGPLPHCEMGDRRRILLIQRRDVRRGGRHVFAEHLFQHPHAALHRAGAIGQRCGRQNARHAQHSSAMAVAQPDLAHLGSLHCVFQAVNRRHRAIEIRVIAVHETNCGFVVPDDALEEQTDFVIHRLAQGGGHLRKQSRVEDLALQAADVQPLSAEAIEQSPRTGIVEQAFRLRLENRGHVQLSAVGQSHQFFVRHGCP